MRELGDINDVLRAGADKIAINTAAIKNPNFIDEASRFFGSSTIVIAIEALKQQDKSYLAYTDNGREFTGINVLSWAKECEDRGAGEILLTSIDYEGTGSGFDLELIKLVTQSVSIPVIAHGGGANANHIKQAIDYGRADAVAISSMLHYTIINNSKVFDNNYIDEGNIEFLKKMCYLRILVNILLNS